MATKKTQVKTVGDKLNRVNESFTVNMYDNGYMIEVGGRNSDNDWATAKIMVGSIDELIVLIKEVADMERDS